MASQGKINAVILYGSRARRDTTPTSDVDVCTFVEEYPAPPERDIRRLAPSLPGATLSIVSYCKRDLDAMLAYGSLFLWHIKLEGQVVYGHAYAATLLGALKPFRRHHDEVVYHKSLLSDLVEASIDAWSPNEFDLSVLFTIARNTCMILSHKKGEPVFGPRECYMAATRLFPDMPLPRTNYSQLSHWKAVYERAVDPQARLPCPGEMKRLVSMIARLLEYADEQTR